MPNEMWEMSRYWINWMMVKQRVGRRLRLA